MLRQLFVRAPQAQLRVRVARINLQRGAIILDGRRRVVALRVDFAERVIDQFEIAVGFGGRTILVQFNNGLVCRDGRVRLSVRLPRLSQHEQRTLMFWLEFQRLLGLGNCLIVFALFKIYRRDRRAQAGVLGIVAHLLFQIACLRVDLRPRIARREPFHVVVRAKPDDRDDEECRGHGDGEFQERFY